MITVAVSHKWRLKSLDVKAAFLQGNEIQRDVYIKLPIEADTTEIWKLHKCVYGLGEASRLWYMRLKEELHSFGVTESKFDAAIFFCNVEDQRNGMIAAHVNDVLWADTPQFENNVIEKFKTAFLISKQCCDNFIYVGLSLVQTDGQIEIHPNHYISDTKPIEIQNKMMQLILLNRNS